MGSTGKFFLNSVLLSAASVTVRFVSVSFNAHVAVKVGAECMGLFTLTSSVYSLCVILASAGANLAVVRAVSETRARCEKRGADPSSELRRVMRSAVGYSLAFGVLTGGAVFLLSDFIGTELLGDERCVMSLKAFAASLPAISLSSSLSGYFTGVGKVYKNAVCAVSEQAVKILLVSSLLILIAPRGIEYACLAIVGGGAAAEGISLVTAYILYKTDKTRKRNRDSPEAGRFGIKDVAALAVPVAVGSAARNGLITAEHLSIPRGLAAYGMTPAEALSVYGILHGMVMPVVMFPSAVLYSFAGLLIPELSACRAVGDVARIKNIEEKVFRSSLLFYICVSGVFLSFSEIIGTGLYGSAEAGRQLGLMALLVPVMYLDSAVDGMLKGLGEEKYCMKVNVVDSTLCLVLVFVLVPAFGIDGYIALTVISELVNAALSVMRLARVAPFRPDLVRWIALPVLSVSAGAFCSRVLASAFPNIGFVPSVALCVAVYGASCFATGAVGKGDVRWLSSVF